MNEDFEDIEKEETEAFADVAPTEGEVHTTPSHDGSYKVGATRAARYRLMQKVKDDLMDMVCDEMDSLKSVLGELKTTDPKGYASTMAALLKFVAPTLASQTLEVEGDTNITIEHKLNMLMQPQTYSAEPTPGASLERHEYMKEWTERRKNAPQEEPEPQTFFLKRK